ncbi:alpha/beta hydrolase [Deinococcus psychrotolerans]|uniref:Alpha/beta hydrolase n=1 Tax=Deinococcus psychrotolerans TaxID=2489213 RepID=A0A3G8Y984_9DEIO|nr:dienelactone hydrolase family protein [Deinococcus psychrotolerans]AZI41932.1 alpha/beta hydrolase [Deinococcus psychrotolerans]
MKNFVGVALTLACGFAIAGGSGPTVSSTQAVTFQAGDGLTVYANYIPASPGAPVILLFHQADNNKSEYADITPQFRRLGFATLAVDARSGHATHAGDNRNLTAEAYEKKTGNTAGYDQALPDLEAALAWAKRADQQRKVFVVGSSYSANLVLFLGAQHPQDVQGILSFSPQANEATLKVASTVKIPVFITSSDSTEEIEAVKAIYSVLKSANKVQYVPTSGSHGALALSSVFNPAGNAGYWKALGIFLNGLK